MGYGTRLEGFNFMANPQKENGYTPIANELFDALAAFRMPGELRQVFDAILRKTYGFNKKEDAIANSQIAEATKLNKQNVFRSLKRLIEHRLVIKTDYQPKKGNILKINKDYQGWIPFVIKTDYKRHKSSKLITAVIKTDDKRSSKLTDTKDKRHIKDNTSKKESFLRGNQWSELIDSFEPLNPLFTDIYKNKTERNALDVMAQKIGYEKLLATVRALPEVTSRPYAPRITKPTELRRDFGKLLTFYNQEKNKDKAKKPVVLI